MKVYNMLSLMVNILWKSILKWLHNKFLKKCGFHMIFQIRPSNLSGGVRWWSVVKIPTPSSKVIEANPYRKAIATVETTWCVSGVSVSVLLKTEQVEQTWRSWCPLWYKPIFIFFLIKHVSRKVFTMATDDQKNEILLPHSLFFHKCK